MKRFIFIKTFVKFPDNHDTGNDDNDDDHQNADNETDTTEQNENPAPKPAKKKRVRKTLSTVTKNKDTINAKLDTIPLPDPLFSKLNSIMGDVSSSNRLLLNILETNDSDLKLTLDDKFWDDADGEAVEYRDDNIYECDEESTFEMPVPLNVTSQHRIRQQLSGYMVVNTPIDDDEEEAPPLDMHNSFNNSHLDYVFDINAEVEDEPAHDNFVMDYDLDDAAGGEADELTVEDREALAQCKGLRRVPTVIEELRPADTTKLEYSYRALDNINQYWAGPSYWKIRKSRKTTMSTASNASTSTVSTVVEKRQTCRQRAKAIPNFYEVVREKPAEETAKDMANFIPERSKNGQKWKKNNLYRRWDSKKMKLPTDLRIDPDLFDTYVYAPGLRIQPINPNVTPHPPSDFDNIEERELDTPGVSSRRLPPHHRQMKIMSIKYFSFRSFRLPMTPIWTQSTIIQVWTLTKM